MAATRRDFTVGGMGAALMACSAGDGDSEPAGGAPAPPAGPLLTRRIPRTDETLPIVGLGTWQAYDIAPGEAEWDEGRAGLKAFVERGGRVVDSSPMYGKAEAAIGALAGELGARDELFVATKVWTSGREAGVRQMEASLQKLGVTRVDLMQVHNLLDLETHLATLADWKAKGRVRYVGVTHYTEGAYDALEAAMRRHRLDFIQINYSVAERESEDRILPLAADRGMGVLINRPFAGGDLFSRLRRQPLPAWAGEIGAASWAQVLLKFVLSHPAVTAAIPGTRNPRHILDNLAAAVGPLPDPAQRARIADAARGA